MKQRLWQLRDKPGKPPTCITLCVHTVESNYWHEKTNYLFIRISVRHIVWYRDHEGLGFLAQKSYQWMTIWLMPSDKQNLITAKAAGLISSLFNVALSRDVPFCQPQQLQYLHHDSTKANLCSPFLSPLPHRWRFAVAPLHVFMEDLVTAVIEEVFIMLSFCFKFSVNVRQHWE